MKLNVIPLKYGTKIPVKGCNWRDETVPVDMSTINTQSFGVALVLGKKSGIVALDLDDDIDHLHEKVLEIAGLSPIAKKGKKGATYFYRYNGEGKHQYNKNGVCVLDLLGEGAYTVLPPSIHPDTKEPYRYMGARGLHEISIIELPFLPTDFKEQLDVLFGKVKPELNKKSKVVDEEIHKALSFINNPPNELSYDEWLSVGMALKSEYGEGGLELWYEVSGHSPKSTGKSIPHKWASFTDGGITIATVYKLAMDNGYVPDDTLYTVQRARKKMKLWKEDGYPVGDFIGLPQLNDTSGVVWHLRKKEFTVITGKPNSGKSEFLDYLIHETANNLQFKTFFVSFEKDPAKHIESHVHRYTGKILEDRTDEEQAEGERFVNEHFYFYNHTYKSNKIEDILRTIKSLTNKIDIDIIVIDPFSDLVSDCGSAEHNMEHVKKVCLMLSKYAKMLDVHVFLIAHPKSYDDKQRWDKEKKKYVPAGMSLYSISGGATFNNKCDNGVIISRCGKQTEIRFAKIREQEFDKTGSFLMEYDKLTRTFKEPKLEY